MKPKDYIKKYKFDDPKSHFSHKEFMADFIIDFISVFETTKSKDGTPNYAGFASSIRVMRQKWDAINERCHIQELLSNNLTVLLPKLPEKLWKYFWATTVVPMRDELFPGEYERQKEEREERQRNAYWDGMYGDPFGYGSRNRRSNSNPKSFFEHLFDEFMNSFGQDFRQAVKQTRNRQSSSFTILGISDNSSEDEIKTAYRKLAHIHHPDKGGNPKKFLEVTEAKNRCLVARGVFHA